MGLKPVKQRDNEDLLELTLQLHSRALAYLSKEMHDAYIEARTELKTRFKQSLPQAGSGNQDGWISVDNKPEIGEYVLVNIETDTVLKGRLMELTLIEKLVWVLD